jgi:fluoride ion exporter CrcB/FEX
VLWVAVAVASLGCLALKITGYAVPPGLLDRRAVGAIVDAAPVGLLSALVAISTFASGRRLVLDSRAAGLAAAIALVALRMPFVVVVVGACGVAAGVHALHS